MTRQARFSVKVTSFDRGLCQDTALERAKDAT